LLCNTFVKKDIRNEKRRHVRLNMDRLWPFHLRIKVRSICIEGVISPIKPKITEYDAWKI